MALDIFLKLADIPGESHDVRHKDEIVVFSWDWGVSQNVVQSGSGGGGGVAGSAAGRPMLRNLRFTHALDAASPLLMLACVSGRHLKDAVLTVARGGAAPDSVVLRLSGVMITSVDAAVNEEKGGLFETVTLAFEKITLDYTPQTATGAPGTAAHFGWDLTTGRVA
jgi:type VI secretion system secreted protein Hcp